LKETIEVELPIGQDENNLGGETINDAWLQHDTGKREPLVESTSFDIGKVIIRHEATRESRSIYSDFIPDASRKAEAQSRSVGLMALFSKKGDNTPTEDEEGDNNKSNTDVDDTNAGEKASQVEKVTEHLKQEEDGVVVKGKPKKTRPSFKFLRRGKMTKEAVVSNALDVEETSVARVQRLEMELSQLSKEIARTKEEAASLSRRRQLPLAQRMAERGLMGTLLGKTIKENEEFKETETPSDVLRRDQMEEGIEVMPTLSDAEFISVCTPVTVDESAFEQKPNLLQRTGSLIKRHPLRRNGSFTKMSKKEKELFRRAKAMANADNRYQETFEDEFDSDYAQATTLEVPVADVGEADTMEVPADAIPDPNDCVCEDEDDNQHDSPHVTFSSEKGVTSFTDEGGFMYDEEIADLVPKNTSTSMDYEDEDANEFVISSNVAQTQTRPIEVREFIEIPEKRIPARRVRSKEPAIQTHSSPMTGQQMISPRSRRAYKESLFDSLALFSAKACMGTSRAVLSCADTCNDNNPDSRVHEALERTSSHSGGHGYDYNPVSPQAPSMFRCGNETYSKEEEDLVTRAFVNALHRVDTALHTAGEEKSPRGAKKMPRHSAMRSGRHSKRRVDYNDIMSVDGKFVNVNEYKSRRKERVPRNLALKPKVQTPRVMEEIREGSRDEQELTKYKEKKSLGNKVLKGFKKLAKARIVYDDA
jgi:hypothetical protein